VQYCTIINIVGVAAATAAVFATN